MNDNKDFFDNEYEKLEEERQRKSNEPQQNGQPQSPWYSYNVTPQPDQVRKKNKPLYISLLCLGIVLALVLGWFLCALAHNYSDGGITDRYLQDIYTYLTNDCNLEITDEQWQKAVGKVNKKLESGQLEKENILVTVLDYLYDAYYKDVSSDEVVSDEQWAEAIANAGTALLNGAGDRYSHLMSPQDYYDFCNPTSTVVSSQGGGIFGISYNVYEGVGLVVSQVLDNSSCFGRLEDGDIILKMTDVKDKSGNALTVGGEDFSTILCNRYARADIQLLMYYVNSATFHVLRDGEVLTYDVERGKLDYPNSKYEFDFVEFYFGDDLTNVSITNMDKSGANTKDLRLLANLPSGVGYIRIKEFNKVEKSNAASEFKQAMDLFKQRNCSKLILDLKGNPGGYVNYAADIVGMLIDDSNLTAEQKAKVDVKGDLLITSLVARSGAKQTETRKGTYSTYFAPAQNGVKNIVIWTDGNSASASELTTGALLDYGTAVQMGTKTYGKGIAQTVRTLSFSGDIVTNSGRRSTGNWAIYFTYASYYSPLGTNIHGSGYTPSSEFDGLDTYQKLWASTLSYWGLD